MQISRLAIELAEMESMESEEEGVPRLINVGPESLGAFRGLRHLFFDCSCTWSMVYTLRYVCPDMNGDLGRFHPFVSSFAVFARA